MTKIVVARQRTPVLLFSLLLLELKVLFLTLALVGLMSSFAAAQISGSLAGTVEDASGAVAPGVQILLVNQATGSKYPATTNEKGGFYVGDLESGLYTVTATKQGFRVSSVKDVKVD